MRFTKYSHVHSEIGLPFRPANFLANRSIADPAYFRFVKALADARLTSHSPHNPGDSTVYVLLSVGGLILPFFCLDDRDASNNSPCQRRLHALE